MPPIHLFRKIYLPLGLLLLPFLTGVGGFMLIENYRFIDAIYMTTITIATVGFMEVKPLSDAGRMFTTFLILSNIGVFTYSISRITSFLLGGEAKLLFKDYRVNQAIAKLKDHVIVCGYGRIGHQVLEELRFEKQEFVVIEAKEEFIASFRQRGDILFVVGDATNEDTLEQAGLSRAKALITTLPKDADNVFVALTARQLRQDLLIISRASLETSIGKLYLAGCNHVIQPERIGGSHMASVVLRPDVVEFIEMLSQKGGTSIFFEEINFDTLQPDLKSKTIRDLNIRNETGANIIGMKLANGEYCINPTPDMQFPQGSKIIILGTEEQMKRLIEKFRIGDKNS